jgi:hypothetical protein
MHAMLLWSHESVGSEKPCGKDRRCRFRRGGTYIKTLQFKVLISTIGPEGSGSLRIYEQDSFHNPKIKTTWKNKLNRLHFTSITFKKENYVPTTVKTIVKGQKPTMEGGKVDDSR